VTQIVRISIINQIALNFPIMIDGDFHDELRNDKSEVRKKNNENDRPQEE